MQKSDGVGLLSLSDGTVVPAVYDKGLRDFTLPKEFKLEDLKINIFNKLTIIRSNNAINKNKPKKLKSKSKRNTNVHVQKTASVVPIIA